MDGAAVSRSIGNSEARELEAEKGQRGDGKLGGGGSRREVRG